jgi:hypothetical protein
MVTGPALGLDQAVAVQHGTDGAFGGNANIRRQSPDEALANLARAPMRLVLFEMDDQALKLSGQLVGVATRRRKRSLSASSPCSL